MSVTKHSLGNGVRVLCERVDHVESVAVGLWCFTGSVDEQPHEFGITHFLEHMLFKGTARRTARQIVEDIEGRGGMINAFTDKETTCYYCRTLAQDLPVAIDVLADMMSSSLLDPAEIELEKGVVLEEIRRLQDEPSDLVHDLHLEKRWPGHPLGRPVIGTEESVRGFSRDDLVAYLERRYRGGRVVLAIAGKVEPDQAVEWASEHLGGLPAGDGEEALERPEGRASETYSERDVEQVHFCIGADGCGSGDEEIYTLGVLDGVLGAGMSSRLFQEIRERRGLAYSIGSYFLSYRAGGAFTVYGGTNPEAWPEVRALVRKEFDRVMEGDLSEEELERVRRNLCGNTVLALEGMSARMMRLARNEFHYGRHVPVEETLERVRAVRREDVVELARHLLAEDRVSTTAIGPSIESRA